MSAPSHLFDGAVFRLRGQHSPLIEEVEGDEERGAQSGHGGGQRDGDVPEENHKCAGSQRAEDWRFPEGYRTDGRFFLHLLLLLRSRHM